jgi:hypothetical protein
MDERTEQKILSLVTQAALRNDDQTYVELWTAASWINRLEIPARAAMTTAILGADPRVAVVWASFLLDALAKMEAQLEEIADGVPFEYDGMKLQAVEVGVAS